MTGTSVMDKWDDGKISHAGSHIHGGHAWLQIRWKQDARIMKKPAQRVVEKTGRPPGAQVNKLGVSAQ